MSPKFHKFKLLLDENMSARTTYRLVNHLFDVKHIASDLKKGGLRDEQVHKEAAKMQRLIITFNGKDFKTLAATSNETGIIFVSRNLADEYIDTKLAGLLLRSTPNSLYGKFTPLTGET
jgi:predicted nuclease of predicted toxin-antitoxin system